MLTSIWALGCTFGGAAGSSGSELGGGSGDATGEVGSSEAESTGDAEATAADGQGQPGTLTTPTGNGDGPADDGPGDDDATQAESGDASDGEPIDCDHVPFYKEVVLAADAVRAGPMAEWSMPALPGAACVGSTQQGEGTAAFVWNAPCDGDYHLWAHVWDDFPAALGDNDPDSFYVRADDGEEIMWRYGCQTAADVTQPGAWYWLPIEKTTTCVFGKSNETYAVDAGAHSFVFRNREAGSFDANDPPGHVAAIARILVTNDPNYVPTNLD